MHNTVPTQSALNSDQSTIKLACRSLAKGHQAHKSGAGQHGDRRLKRLKTRHSQKRAAFSDWR